MRRRDVRASLAALLVLAALGGCSREGCTTPDDELVASVMERARSGFVVGDNTIDRVELVRARQVALPEGDREAGGVAVLALRTAQFERDPLSEAVPGLEVTALFLLDDDDRVVGPVNGFAEESFDVPPPDLPDWRAARERVDGSPAVDAVAACAEA